MAPEKKRLCTGKRERAVATARVFPFLGVCLTPRTHRQFRGGEETRNAAEEGKMCKREKRDSWKCEETVIGKEMKYYITDVRNKKQASAKSTDE